MQIKVTNRGTAEVITFEVPYIVISIYSTNSKPANIPTNPNCLDVLPICFDDVAEDIITKEVTHRVITEQQANKIWTFVDYYLQREHTNKQIDNTKAKLILIHSDTGICRSSAVAAAINKIYTGEDKEWFRPPYCPNIKVYNTMLKVKGLSNEY